MGFRAKQPVLLNLCHRLNISTLKTKDLFLALFSFLSISMTL